MIKKILFGLAVVAFAWAGVAIAQQGGIKRTPLQKVEFPEGYNSVTEIVEIKPGGSVGRHTHPGIETGYLLEGEVDLLVRRQARPALEGWRFLFDSGGCGARPQCSR